jgi:NAD(P)-dependent dehydrogenase (short-subunit alcohol dehydrogenase family)
MSAELRDRVAVVTGAGSGLGAALSRVLARAGARLVLADLDLAAAERTAGELRAGGADVRPCRVDVGDPAALEALAARTADWYGGAHILCANVGVVQFGALDALGPGDWEWVFGVNVLGTVGTVRAFLPQLRAARGRRHVLLTASTSALFAAPRLGVYTASKYAVLGFGETLRMELGPEGIGVSVLLPGPMATNHLRSSAAAKPERIGTPHQHPGDLEAVSAATLDDAETLDPEHAVRNVLRELAADAPYIFTHPANGKAIRARFDALLEAHRRSGETG